MKFNSKVKRFKFYLTNISLFIFFIFVAYEVYKSINQEKVQNQKIKTNSVFEPKILEIIEMQLSAGQKVIDIVKENESWKIKSPIEDFVSQETMDSILNEILNSNTESQNDIQITNWANYGLNDPLGTVVLKGKNGYKIQIDVSQTKAFDGRVYLKWTKNDLDVRQERLLISDMNWSNLILKTPLEFVSKKNVFKIDPLKVKTIEILNVGVFFKKDKLWEFNSDVNNKNLKEIIDPAKAEVLIKTFNELNILEFDSKNSLKIIKSSQSIKFVLSTAKTIEVKFYDHFKRCSTETNDSGNCQLISSNTIEHPFWVLESELKAIKF